MEYHGRRALLTRYDVMPTDGGAVAVEPELQAHYETRARQVWRWHNHARRFVCSANRLVEWYLPILEKETHPPEDEKWNSSFQPIMMLLGIAAENLLKALLVARGTDPVSEGKLVSRLQTHNLRSLWQDCGLPLDADSDLLLQRLRDFIESGKYPIGLAAGKGLGATYFAQPGDLDHVYSLLQKLDDAVCGEGSSMLGSVDLSSLCCSASPVAE